MVVTVMADRWFSSGACRLRYAARHSARARKHRLAADSAMLVGLSITTAPATVSRMHTNLSKDGWPCKPREQRRNQMCRRSSTRHDARRLSSGATLIARLRRLHHRLFPVGVRERDIQRLFKGVRDSLIRAAYVGRTTWFEILFAHA